jgi:hypothetical protein
VTTSNTQPSTFPNEGETKVEAHGFQGSGCTKFTAPFIEALGQSKEHIKKDSFFRKASNYARQKLKL